MGKGCIRVEDADGEDRDPVWVTPDSSRMPHCKICNAQGCMHFRRGFAHLLALNLDCGIPTLATEKSAGDEGQPANVDILIPTTCPCHGCNELVVRADLNRGHDKSLSYNMDPKTGEWKAEFVRYRYKRDTELVIGCGGRHKIIESPKAGRYAQLWCRTCCNCSLSSKAIGNLVGCTNTAHWHTVTNRSYHEKTPFHQLAHNLLLVSYAEALQAGIPFEDAIGLTGQTYYKMSADKGGDLNEQPGGGAPRRELKGVDGAQGIRSLKRERGVKDVHLMMHEGATAHAPAPQGLNGVDAQLLRDPQLLRGPDLRGVNGLNGMMGISSSSSQSHLHQLGVLQPGFWPHADLRSSGSSSSLQIMQQMQEARAVSEGMRMTQKQRTGVHAGMKQQGAGSMLQPHMPMRNVLSQGINGMMSVGKGANQGRGDQLMQPSGMSFGMDAYNAFRGMFEGGGSAMGINIGAGLSGNGLQGYSNTIVSNSMFGSNGMRGPSLNLLGLGHDLLTARLGQSQSLQSASDGSADQRQADNAMPTKSNYYDLENVPDILTRGGM